MTKQIGNTRVNLDFGAMHAMVSVWVQANMPFLAGYDIVNLSATSLTFDIRENNDGKMEGQGTGLDAGRGCIESPRSKTGPIEKAARGRRHRED